MPPCWSCSSSSTITSSRSRVGWEYEAYRGKVPRWFPRQLAPAFAYPAQNTVAETLYRERSGILGVAATIAVLAAATWFYVIR
jgi:hypothetical protein